MTDPRPLHLLEGFGVELEYMIVAAGDLAVLPVADKLLRAVAGRYESEVELGPVAWSNELVLHVVEMKTNGPSGSLDPVPAAFQEHVGRINALLGPLGGRLMPTAMHPWMDPAAEMRLWPHEYSPVYEAYHRIFDCRGHGWANLQAVHLNLPFAGDEEFGRLHAAIRLVLPIMPALAASSPVMDGRLTGLMDTRLHVYRTNARRIRSITGSVIPEPVFSRAEYEQVILRRMYDDIRPLDPEGVLQHEFLNSRGAIARFDRSAIEIRVLDMQECPAADVAVCAAVADVVRALLDEQWSGLEAQQAMPTEPLAEILLATTRDAEQAVIGDRAYLDQFGFPGQALRATAGELWQHLCETSQPSPPRAAGFTPAPADSPPGAAGFTPAPEHSPPSWVEPLRTILRDGPLARRITRALAGDTSPDRLRAVYARLCDCLAAGRMFTPCD